MMTKPIEIDLRRDLPKVREQWDALMKALPKKSCSYVAPCVIGAMVAPKERRILEANRSTIGDLIQRGIATAPKGQSLDMYFLQKAFDKGELAGFQRTLERVEAKYLDS